MVIDGDGRVGILNVTPGTNHAKANNLVVGSGAAGGMAVWSGTNEGWYAFSRGNANNTDAYDGGMSYNGDRDLKFHTNAGSTRMTIDGQGKVGIGTTDPQGHLHVHSTSGDGFLYLTGDNNPLRGVRLVGHNGGMTFQINTGSDSSYTERARFETNGHMGIHNNAPKTSLELGGTTADTNTGGGVGMITLNPPNTPSNENYTPTVIGLSLIHI